MNHDNVLALADFVEHGNAPFNMFKNSTCLIGQSAAVQGKPWEGSGYNSVDMLEYMGIEPSFELRRAIYLAGYELDAPAHEKDYLSPITRSQAATFLRVLAAAGDEGVPITPAAIKEIWADVLR